MSKIDFRFVSEERLNKMKEGLADPLELLGTVLSFFAFVISIHISIYFLLAQSSDSYPKIVSSFFKTIFWPGNDQSSTLSTFSTVINFFTGLAFNSTVFGIIIFIVQSIKDVTNFEVSSTIKLYSMITKESMRVSNLFKFRTISWIYLVAILIFGLVGCNEAVNENIVYKWGGPKTLELLPILAQEKGFFSDEGLNTERNDIQTGKQAMDALINGSIDFGILVETNISFIKFQPGSDLRVVAIIQEKYDDAIVVDSSIIRNALDLRGQTIAVTYATTAHSFALKYLKEKGISIDSVEIKNLPPLSIQAALINGELAAGSIWQPFRYNAVSTNSSLLELNSKTAYKGYSIIVVRDEFARENPEAIKKFLSALIEAEEYLNQNLDASQRILAEQISMPESILKKAWNEYNVEVKLSDELTRSFISDAEWIIQTEDEFKNQAIPDYSQVVDTTFLYAVAPNRVNGSE